MEVPGMDEVTKMGENGIAAFVQQEAFDDGCSICLEAFSLSEPSTTTICRHDFHLQCILEWCQRSSNCPMCWQPISLIDEDSQELLVAVEQERSFRSSPSRNAAMYHHPTTGGSHLQHLRSGVDEPDQIIQQLVAAAAIWRGDEIGRGEGSRSRSARQRFMVSSAAEPDPSATETILSAPAAATDNRYSSIDTAGPSESLSDTWRTRLGSISLRYTQSISENTRAWKERLFSRSSSSMPDIVINSGIASVSHLDSGPSNGSNTSSSAD